MLQRDGPLSEVRPAGHLAGGCFRPDTMQEVRRGVVLDLDQLIASGSRTGPGRRRGPGRLRRPGARRRRHLAAQADKATHILTANITSHGSLSSALEQPHFANSSVIGLQEHKLRDPQQIAAFRKRLARMGWDSFVPPALTGQGGGASAGVALLWRAWLSCFAEPELLWPGRVAVAYFHFSRHGRIVVYSVYGFGEGIKANSKLLQTVIQHVMSHDMLYMIIGDFNTSPEDMHTYLSEELYSAKVVWPGHTYLLHV